MNKRDVIMFIINPHAGSYCEETWDRIVDELDSREVQFAYYKTRCEGDATKKVQNYIDEGYRHFVAIGGDGTICEVVNGFMMQNYVDYDELTLSAISYGTGNDWVRYYGYKRTLSAAIDGILEGDVVTQDVGLIHYYQNGEHRRKYFVNSAGFGFDAKIIEATKKQTENVHKSGKASYLLTLLKTLITCRKTKFTIKFNGKTMVENTLSMSVANGKFSGGGMQQTPDAMNNDGLLDVALYGDISKFTVVKNVKKLYNGTIKELKDDHIYHFRTPQIEISSPSETICEIDGEVIGTGPYKIELLSGVLQVKL